MNTMENSANNTGDERLPTFFASRNQWMATFIPPSVGLSFYLETELNAKIRQEGPCGGTYARAVWYRGWNRLHAAAAYRAHFPPYGSLWKTDID